MRNLINKEIVLLTNVLKYKKKFQKNYFSIKKIFSKLMFLAYSLTIFIKK